MVDLQHRVIHALHHAFAAWLYLDGYHTKQASRYSILDLPRQDYDVYVRKMGLRLRRLLTAVEPVEMISHPK